MNIETGIEEYQEKADAAQETEVAQPSPSAELPELEEAEEILRFVLNLRMYGESETETWKEAERRIENFLRRDHCTQCGMRFSHRACGTTHAMIWNEKQNRTGTEVCACSNPGYTHSVSMHQTNRTGAELLTRVYEDQHKAGE